MKFDFSKKTMEIGTFSFNFVRTLMVAGTGGAEISECLLTAEKIKDNNAESWVTEWAITAQNVAQSADHALQIGQTVTARQAYLRASNYYRTAMFSLPHSDARLDKYLTLSREYFHQAAKLLSPQVEALAIPFGDVRLPGYFLSASQPNRPTLIALNGGDSTNEEMVHWLGFAAVARGWNFLTFEGPGQWSAMQLNPGLLLRPDYEVPVKAVIDYLMQRAEVDPNKIALYGPSLGSILAVRATAFEKRIKACVVSGLIVDVYEGWHAVWPTILQNARPTMFDIVFAGFEKVSPQLHAMANHFRWILGVTKPHEIIDTWKPYNIKNLAPKLHCPLLLLYGEAEVAQSNENVALSVLSFVRQLTTPVTMHLFSFEDGWAASHCQIGALAPLQAHVFDWLDKAVNESGQLPAQNIDAALDMFAKYMHSNEAKHEAEDLVRVQQVQPNG